MNEIQAQPEGPSPRVIPNPLLALHNAADAELQNYESVEIVSTFGEPQAEYAAIHKACGLIDLAHRGILELTGDDRLPFLNNLLTNELWSKSTRSGLTAGRGAYAFLLSTHGKIVADMNVIERGDRLYLEMDARLVDTVRKLLDRYLFADKVKLLDRVDSLHELAFHGPGAAVVLQQALDAPVPELPPLGSFNGRLCGVEATIWRDDVCGVSGYHLIVPSESVVEIWNMLRSRFGELVSHARRPLRPMGWAAFNSARIEAGRPLFGVDFDSTILPAETGDETFTRAVSVTKGCYLGQEIVARMFARKQFAKQIVLLRLEGETLPIAGSPVYDDAGNAVGGVTSSTISPIQSRAAICLALVKKLFAVDGKIVQVPAEGAMRKAVVSIKLRSVAGA